MALHWRGEDGSERAITYAELLADVQRLANALKDLGVRPGDVVGIYLPMIPEVVVSMLACARIGAPHNVVFGGFSAEAVRERMEFSEAKVLITVDGAARKGRTAAVKDRVDEVMGDLQTLQKIVVVQSKGTPCSMTGGRDVFYAEIMAAAGARVPGRAAGLRAPAVRALHLGLDRQAEGHPAHHRRLPDGRVAPPTGCVFDLRPESDVYWCAADVGWVTGPLLHRLRPALQRGHLGDVGGRPRLPRPGASGGRSSSATGSRSCTAPRPPSGPASSGGPQWPNARDLSSLRLLGSVGEPINPKAWLWYHKVIGGERCPIVDTWWQTETGGDHDHPAAGHHGHQAGLRHEPVPGRVRRSARRVHRASRSRKARGCSC